MDPLSGEWTTGVFAAMWAKYNNRANAYNTWIIADGPVDAIWIEDLNTVLDDNKILTLANGATIRRASGSLSVAPSFVGIINLAYIYLFHREDYGNGCNH